jgi:hypothetical protein
MRMPKALIGTALVGIIAVTGVLLYLRRPASPPLQLFRSSLLPPSNSTFVPGSFAMSPDGKTLAFSAQAIHGKSALWVRSLSAPGAHRLDATEDAPRIHFGHQMASNSVSLLRAS